MNTFERSVIDLDKLKPHGIEMWLHHIRRYQFAASFLKETDTVLDICCGSGYGTAIMAECAHYVLGIDKSEEAIIYAYKKYPGNKYECRDIAGYQFGNSFDIITMFECLDHLKKEDGLNVLTRAARSCQGIMFLSLPQDQKIGTNPYHLAIWDTEELKKELEGYFSRVILFGQSWSTGAVTFPYDERRSMTIFVGIK